MGKMRSISEKNVFVSLAVVITMMLSACSSSEKSVTADQATVEYDLLYTLPKEKISYKEEVQPILESRCVVCDFT
jgi:uncharacterized lipoprotein YehR (DUF1307 family)